MQVCDVHETFPIFCCFNTYKSRIVNPYLLSNRHDFNTKWHLTLSDNILKSSALENTPLHTKRRPTANDVWKNMWHDLPLPVPIILWCPTTNCWKSSVLHPPYTPWKHMSESCIKIHRIVYVINTLIKWRQVWTKHFDIFINKSKYGNCFKPWEETHILVHCINSHIGFTIMLGTKLPTSNAVLPIGRQQETGGRQNFLLEQGVTLHRNVSRLCWQICQDKIFICIHETFIQWSHVSVKLLKLSSCKTSEQCMCVGDDLRSFNCLPWTVLVT